MSDRWITLVGSLAIALLLALRVLDPTPIAVARNMVFDAWQILSPRPVTQTPVAIVAIDDASLDRRGQWPWPRHLLATLTERLTGLGAAAVGYTIVFAEPDRTSPRNAVAAWPSSALRNRLRFPIHRLPDHDTLFADALAQSNSVLAFTSGADSDVPAVKAGLATIGTDPAPFLLPLPGAVGNLPALDEAAAAIGASVIDPDADGVARRLPLLVQVGGQVRPAFLVEVLRVAQGASTLAVRTGDARSALGLDGAGGVEVLRVGAVDIPTTPDARLWLHLPKALETPRIPAWTLLEETVPGEVAEQIAGHIVLVGVTAAGAADLHALPGHTTVSGAEVQAQALSQILQGSYLNRPAWADGAEILMLLVLASVLLALMPRIGVFSGALVGGVVTAVAVGGSWLAFARGGLLLDPVYPSLATLAVYLPISFLVYLRTERERGQVRSAFSRYLAPQVVARLAEHPEDLRLGGETRNLTLLFCDVRNFTRLSEEMDAHDLTRFINRFLTPMTQAILARGGTIDKYMGDAIMAFWNAPIDDPDHRRQACLAALDMSRALVRLNDELASEHARHYFPVAGIGIGIGLNTGPCVVGNLGSDQRFDYSAIGDAVNLASRLEGQTRTYGVEVLAGEATHDGAPGLAWLEVDLIRVRGRMQPERIYALLGDEALAESAGFGDLASAHADLLDAYRALDLDAADAALARCREHAEPQHRPLYDLYAGRLAELRASPPSGNWDGVYTALTK
ncbi:MAG: adenylate/guanylate cyclase domain-containing protein [Alphaproteobacteria bacterium]|nr:adenylate/guanylate cyclase domain-containing protein [Alphaproteobacteria bacterium]